ncbi:MAG TPA: DUF4129 domain-containing protein [Frankiaceae bacterium]|nr:DUF4129 domain-containing protein [Frankiaceae bacterium]
MSGVLLPHLQLLAAAPLTRDGARQDASRELQRGVYHDAQPSLLARAVNKVIEFIRHLFSRASDATPGGTFGLLVLVLLLVVAVVVVIRLGPLRRPQTAGGGLDVPAAVTPAQLRTQADTFAAQQQWAEAVRARLRAVVRLLEERTLIEPRPGRTAYEVARDAGAVAPELRSLLESAAATFSEVWYGGRDGTAQDYRGVVELDDAVQRYRPSVRQPAPAQPGPAVPA